MNRLIIIVVAVALLCPSLLMAQKQKTERAYAAYNAGSYYEAIDYFKDVYSKTRDKQLKADMVFMVSECYRLINDPKNAELWYKGLSGRLSRNLKLNTGWQKATRSLAGIPRPLRSSANTVNLCREIPAPSSRSGHANLPCNGSRRRIPTTSKN